MNCKLYGKVIVIRASLRIIIKYCTFDKFIFITRFIIFEDRRTEKKKNK